MLQLLCDKRNLKYQDIKVGEETTFQDEGKIKKLPGY